jgi:phenylpyruvate tautomerase PptA (4-oxalocrotonate tautomerase family)
VRPSLGGHGRNSHVSGVGAPLCTCSTGQGALTAGAKRDLTAGITRIHAEIDHVPPACVWTAIVPAHRWPAHRTPGRDFAGEHRRLEQAALARNADTAAEVLAQHLTLTAGLAGSTDPEPAKEA